MLWYLHAQIYSCMGPIHVDSLDHENESLFVVSRHSFNHITDTKGREGLGPPPPPIFMCNI